MRTVALLEAMTDALERITREHGIDLVEYLIPITAEQPGLSHMFEADPTERIEDVIRNTVWTDSQVAAALAVRPWMVAVVRDQLERRWEIVPLEWKDEM